MSTKNLILNNVHQQNLGNVLDPQCLDDRFPTAGLTERKLILLITGRCGSTMLHHAIESRGVCPPNEIFNTSFLNNGALFSSPAPYGVVDYVYEYRRYILGESINNPDRLVSYSLTPWELSWLIENAPDLTDWLFRDSVILVLTRRNILRQAASYATAVVTGLWHSFDETIEPATYPEVNESLKDEAVRFIELINWGEMALRSWEAQGLHSESRAVIKTDYENLVENLGETVDILLSSLDLPLQSNRVEPIETQRLAPNEPLYDSLIGSLPILLPHSRETITKSWFNSRLVNSYSEIGLKTTENSSGEPATILVNEGLKVSSRENDHLYIIASHGPRRATMLSEPYLEICNSHDGEELSGYSTFDNSYENNLASKNNQYCELSPLYSIWKNDFNYNMIGLGHYRRFLNFDPNAGSASSHERSFEERKNISENLVKYLPMGDNLFFVPTPRRVESIFQQFATHHAALTDIFMYSCEIYNSQNPNSPSAEIFFRYTSNLSPFNMFYGSKNLVDQWCNQIFNLLFELEKHVPKNLGDYQTRWAGFIAERYLNLFVSQLSRKVNVYFLPVVTFHST